MIRKSVFIIGYALSGYFMVVFGGMAKDDRAMIFGLAHSVIALLWGYLSYSKTINTYNNEYNQRKAK